jgi:hypothetical protein
MKRIFIAFSFFSVAILTSSLHPALAETKVRTPAFNGKFYPASPDELRKNIKTFLEQAKTNPDSNVKALIVPHAGYPYSGLAAGEAYKLVLGENYDDVIIIGFAHRPSFNGIYVDESDFYETPLGKVPLDQALARQIRDFNSILKDQPTQPLEEHSIEVQIPFLQETIKNLKIVPIYMGSQNPEHSYLLAAAIKQAIGNRKVLIVVTSDLTHYEPEEAAKKKDSHLIALLGQSDINNIIKAYSREEVQACGIGPLLSLLKLQQLSGWNNPELLRYATSAESSGDHQSVVGYASLAISKGGNLDHDEKQKMLEYVRALLVSQFQKNATEPQLATSSEVLNEKRGVFVTLKKKGELRGCIGHIVTNEPVRKTLREVAIGSAFHDPRFGPLKTDELKDVTIEISILTIPAVINSFKDIRLGIDGIVVEQGWKTGVYLPEVATDTGWNQETFFKNCALTKAGISADSLDKTKIYAFQTDSFQEERK